MLQLALNAALRLSIGYFLAEVMAKPNDPRFKGKAIPIRNLIVVGSFSLLFPVAHFALGRWSRYPFAADNLYLSIFWLDMAGNSLDLYDRVRYFDLIAHAHGTGALVAALRAFGLTALEAFGLATGIHVALEAQEYYTDRFFGTHNVGGVADTVNDLVAGLVAAPIYAALSSRAPRA